MSAFATLNTVSPRAPVLSRSSHISSFFAKYANNPRARVALVAAAYEGLTLNVVDVNPFTEGGVSAAYLEKFPMGLVRLPPLRAPADCAQVPTLEKDDLKLFEILAIVNVRFPLCA